MLRLSAEADTYTARMARTRIIRIDTKSTLRFSIVLALCVWLMLLVAGVLLWLFASLTGTLSKIEDFIAQLLAESTFHLDAVKMLLGAGAVGVVLLLTAAIFAGIMSTLFNLISARVGGLTVTVAEVDDPSVFPRG